MNQFCDTLYLQAVRLRSLGGRAFARLVWELVPADQAQASQYLVVDERSAEWQVFGRLLQAPEGAQGATIQLINFDSTGTVQFDDVLLVPVDPPPCSLDK